MSDELRRSLLHMTHGMAACASQANGGRLAIGMISTIDGDGQVVAPICYVGEADRERDLSFLGQTARLLFESLATQIERRYRKPDGEKFTSAEAKLALVQIIAGAMAENYSYTSILGEGDSVREEREGDGRCDLCGSDGPCECPEL